MEIKEDLVFQQYIFEKKSFEAIFEFHEFKYFMCFILFINCLEAL